MSRNASGTDEKMFYNSILTKEGDDNIMGEILKPLVIYLFNSYVAGRNLEDQSVLGRKGR